MIALYDYITMTFSGYTVAEIKSLLGLTDYTFEPGNGARGYAQCEYFMSVKIFSCPAPSNRFNIWLELSGQGCRTFETYGNANYQGLFRLVHDDFENVHLTRLDIAFDDAPLDPRQGVDEHVPGGILDLDQISALVLDVNADGTNDHYTCKSRYWNVERSSKGTTVYFGSPSSLVRFRIYDKAKERGFEKLHWVRFEVQLRDERAASFVIKSLFGDVLGMSFSELINNYIRFIEMDDINKSRCSTSPWWQNFIDCTGKLSVFTAPGDEYNLSRLYHHITYNQGNGIYTLLEVLGEEEFLKSVRQNRSPNFPPKYAVLLQEHRAQEQKKGVDKC